MKSPENSTKLTYKDRINKVFEYIDEKLDSNPNLETLSKVAYFSPFHFHRIFKTITGETVNEYVTRQKIEKAASDLLHKGNRSVTEISFEYGFNDLSSFTRAFKRFYGISPTVFRKQNRKRLGRIHSLKSKNSQASTDLEKYICTISNLKKWIKMNANIEIKQLPKLELAYITSLGEQGIPDAYNRLLKWAKPKGILENANTKLVTIYHDSFKITTPKKVRMSACITLEKPTDVNGEVGLTSIEAGRYIVGSFEIKLNDFEKSWTGLFVWMHENGYKKADRNPFEIYHNDFREHPEQKCIVDFCIPIDKKNEHKLRSTR